MIDIQKLQTYHTYCDHFRVNETIVRRAGSNEDGLRDLIK